jgi:cysteine-rich repeat protein
LQHRIAFVIVVCDVSCVAMQTGEQKRGGMRARFVRRPTLWTAALALLLVGGLRSAAQAHNQPVPIELWGPFLLGAQDCLRAISRATHTCFDTVLALEQRCNDALLRGETCDRDAVDAAVAEADNATRVALGNACTVGQLTEIGYIGFFDAQSDLSSACLTQSRAAVEATYVPAAAGPPEASAAECMVASAAYSRRVMRFILERETPVLERIATRLFSADEKKASILQVERELSATRSRWVAGLLEACPGFATVYGRSPDSFLRTIKQRTDCVISLTYIQSAVSCQTQVCGNGIREGNEQCDDGNSSRTDACRTDCTVNTTPSVP